MSSAHQAPILFPSLEAWLSHLETAYPVGIDMGLERINRVKAALDLHFDCPVITVAGTNGKGSTCAFLESILLASGYRVGCHTSPHLLKFNERARINGEDVNDNLLLEHFAAVEKARVSLVDAPTLTYFEFTTLAIMHLFAKSNLDAVVLEVGMGGRLDAVNIVDADCAIVTSIDIDHADFLGGTREAIGLEKAGIFRPGHIAVCGDPVPPQSLIDYAEKLGCDLWLQGRDYNFQGDKQQWGWVGRKKRFSGLGYPALRGANQILNASAVVVALMALHQRLPVSAQDIRNGFALVELPGRFQILPGQPTVVLDVAHNPHAAATLAQGLDKMGYHPYTYAIFGAMADKDIEGVIKPLLNIVDFWFCTDLSTPRAASAKVLAEKLESMGVKPKNGADGGIECFEDPAAAYQKVLSKAGEGDRIVTFGSFYTVAGVMTYRNKQAHCSMIRLPSFFKRKTQSSDDLELGLRGGRTVKRAALRSLQRSVEAEELTLTEDPEQQRARHRLIGAAVLVLIAVIGLPRILDNRLKLSPNDIAVNIVTSLPIPGAETKPEIKAEPKPEAKPKSDTLAEAPKVATPTPEVKADVKLETKPAAPAASKSTTLGLAVGEEVVANANTKPKVDDASKTAVVNNSGSSNTATSGLGKYVIQIGAFASEERAKGWIAKLKDQKIPYYVTNKPGADGVKLYVLRAGPYTDKDLAEAAEKKIKAMGLSPKLVESGKQ